MLASGTTVAGYRIERMLGSGGMGTVYLATQLSLNRPVALKMLPRELGHDMAFRARFAREGEVQAALDHPHIVPIYEAGESEDGLFLAMRYVRGVTLKDLIAAGELDPERTIRLLTPVAAALDAAHAAGLIHRDVKPQNILVDVTDWPYLADFGLTRAGGGAGLTRTGQLVGTFDYIAPEQVRGLAASARSDQYALAAVLFECLSGEVPYPHDSDAALLYAQVHEAPPSLTERTGDVPEAFDDVVRRGMAKEPDERFPNVTAMLVAAAEALDAPRSRAATETVPGTVPGPPGRFARKAPTTPPADPAAPALASGNGQATVLAKGATPIPSSKPPRARKARTIPALGSWAIPVAAVALAIAGFGLGTALSSGSGPETTTRTLALADGARLSTGGHVVATPAPTGLGLRQTKAYTIAGASPTVLVSGGGRPSGTDLLPAGPIADAAAQQTPAVVQSGGAQALRFDGLHIPGVAGTATVLALSAAPDRATVVVCASAGASRTRCDDALGSLVPGAAARIGIAPPAAYGQGLRDALSAYERRRAEAASLLARAGRASTQASAARRLSSAAGSLQTALGRLEAHPAALAVQARLAAAATGVQRAAQALATAALANDAVAYRRSRTRLADAQQALRRAVAACRDLRLRR